MLVNKQSSLLACAMLLARANAQSSETLMNNGTIAHGILMGLAFAVLFPLGAAVLRIGHYSGQLYVHVGLQALAYSMALAGFGLGVWMAVETDQLTASNGHPIIGIIVIGVLLFQAIGGVLAHALFKKTGRPNFMGLVHKWNGRVFLILGVINGGLGLQLSGNSTAAEIAYGVLAGVFFTLWFVVVVVRKLTESKTKEVEGKRDVSSKEFVREK